MKLSIASQPKAVRIGIWVAIALGASMGLGIVRTQLETQVRSRMNDLAEKWEIFE